MTSTTPAITDSPASRSRTVCWQGWHLDLPRRWDPVKLEGDYSEGYALFADSLRPRLGIKWQTPRKRKFDAEKAVKSALNQEVGALAAAESKPLKMDDDNWESSTLYIEPKPPGRDVWCAFSESSGRLLQVAYHAHRREHILAGMVLPTIRDMPADRAMPWSIFDLTCVIPGGMKLIAQRLNVGDLGLTFADKYHELSVRQIAVAQLALQRMPLDGWIADQQKTSGRYHKAAGVVSDVTIRTDDGRELPGRGARMVRRRRYILMRWRAVAYFTCALHDVLRDRIVIVHSTDEGLVHEIAATVGGDIG
jgi:hypothetical protein